MPPPGPARGGNLTFDVEGVAKIRLAKGWEWKASGVIMTPAGYEGGEVARFFTPYDDMVSIPCTLKALLTLRVETNTPCAVRISQVGRVLSAG